MNMKEIAQLAGVTAATVSNAINGTGNVSEKKRKEIMEIIEKEGYSPNRFAKSLRTKESNTIGIMVEDITAFQTPRIINGINNYVEKQGYAVILNNMSLLEKTGNHYSELSSYQSAISKSIKLFNKTQTIIIFIITFITSQIIFTNIVFNKFFFYNSYSIFIN